MPAQTTWGGAGAGVFGRQIASALGFGAKREWGSILGSCQKAQPAEITQKGAATRPFVTCGQRLLALGATDGGEQYGCCEQDACYGDGAAYVAD